MLKKRNTLPPLPTPPKLPEESFTNPLEFPEIKFEKTSSSGPSAVPDFPSFPGMELETPLSPKFEMKLPEKPVIKEAFIAADEYREILEKIDSVKSKLHEAEDYMKIILEAKEDEEKELEKWRQRLEAIEKKLLYVDKLIEGAES